MKALQIGRAPTWRGMRLSREHPDDRVAYTQGKTEFILRVTQEAKAWAESGAKQTCPLESDGRRLYNIHSATGDLRWEPR